MNSLWETPACASFLENINKEMWSGNIILVFLPKHSPSKFLSAFKKRIWMEKEYNIRYEKMNLLEVDLNEERPIESLLYKNFELDYKTDSFIPKRVPDIFKHIPISRGNYQIVYVFENLSHAILEKFKDFLSNLGRYFTSISENERHKIIIQIDPEKINPNIFNTEPGTSKHLLKGIICPLDQALAIKYYFGFNGTRVNVLRENLIISLSQFDYKLTEDLFSCKDILEEFPHKLLEFASVRDWGKIQYKREDDLNDDEIFQLWSKGILDKPYGKLVYHSSFLKIHNKENELRKRVWNSAIQVLLPLIEEFRSAFINSKIVKLPFNFYNEKKNRTIVDNNEFEISDIVYLINKNQIGFNTIYTNEKKKVKEFANLCRKLRNSLSHLNVPENYHIKSFFNERDEVMQILES